MYITSGDLPLHKTVLCLPTFWSRLLMHGSAVEVKHSKRSGLSRLCFIASPVSVLRFRAVNFDVFMRSGFERVFAHERVVATVGVHSYTKL